MPRIQRVDVADHIYHVLNRANARAPIFDTNNDYQLFEHVLADGVKRFDMRLLSYCLMPNHWHLVLYLRDDGDLSRFMGWVTNTHTRRWHAQKSTIGQGHLYQGRYKSFICQGDKYFLTLCRYVERNAKKANLARKAEQWRWSSAWRREWGAPEQKKMLTSWPTEIPKNYIAWLNEPQTAEEEEVLEHAILRSTPFGSEQWSERIIKTHGLEQTIRNPWRPKKGG